MECKKRERKEGERKEKEKEMNEERKAQLNVVRKKSGMSNLLPIIRYLKNNHLFIKGSLDFLGGFSMISKSGGLKLRAVAGGPSVIRFTHNS